MEGSEIPVFMVSLVLAGFVWARWYLGGRGPQWTGAVTARPVLCYGAPILCFAGLFAILRCFAASDVRDAPVYLLFYEVMGLAWIGALALLISWWGISMRDDVVERRNPAAASMLTGALAGVTLCFAGGNIGNGPGWWVVVFAAVLSTGGLLLVWLIVETAERVAERVTIDRDRSTGVRVGCFLTACGLILGRAVAGDWISVEQTFVDFVSMAWVVVVLAVIEIIIGRSSRPDPRHPEISLMAAGLVPGVLYLGGSFLYVWSRGSW
jgi:hypothetical protein